MSNQQMHVSLKMYALLKKNVCVVMSGTFSIDLLNVVFLLKLIENKGSDRKSVHVIIITSIFGVVFFLKYLSTSFIHQM